MNDRLLGTTLDDGRIVLGEILRAGTHDHVRVGWRADRPDARVLVTLTRAHAQPAEPRGLGFDHVAALVWVGRAGADLDAIVEELPAGRAAHEVVPLDEAAVARLGAALAAVLARVHATGALVDGIRPELVYLEPDTATLTAIVPRGVAFVRTSPQPTGPCLRTYRLPFLAPEVFLLTASPSAASDVFGLCATLWFLAMGRHPFGTAEELSALVRRLVTGELDAPWPLGDALGATLAGGLAADPGRRPSADTLARALAAVTP